MVVHSRFSQVDNQDKQSQLCTIGEKKSERKAPHNYLTRRQKCVWQNSTPLYDKFGGRQNARGIPKQNIGNVQQSNTQNQTK